MVSFVNHLIRRARQTKGVRALDVPATKVGAVVERLVSCDAILRQKTRAEVRQMLLDGKINIFGCPLRVIGGPKIQQGGRK